MMELRTVTPLRFELGCSDCWEIYFAIVYSFLVKGSVLIMVGVGTEGKGGLGKHDRQHQE